jgi:hypothetical protein
VPECQDGQGQEKSASREIGKSAGREEKTGGEKRMANGEVFPAVAEKLLIGLGRTNLFSAFCFSSVDNFSENASSANESDGKATFELSPRYRERVMPYFAAKRGKCCVKILLALLGFPVREGVRE